MMNKIKNIRIAWKIKILAVTIPLVVVLVLASIAKGINATANWFETNTIKVQFPYEVKRQKVVVIGKKEVLLPMVVKTDDLLLVEEKESDIDFQNVIEKSPNKEVAMLVIGTFKEFGDEEALNMLSIFTSESGLRADAKGWNCIYNENGKEVSRACNPEDRGTAINWSVDCGIAQLNFSGTECPKDSFDVFWNVEGAKKKYLTQGKNAWVVYQNGNFKSIKLALSEK